MVGAPQRASPQRNSRQMWLAIVLALVLGGLLATKIVMIASAEKGDTSAEKSGAR